jgi:hypothetical protein
MYKLTVAGFSGRDLNSVHPEYQVGVLITLLRGSVQSVLTSSFPLVMFCGKVRTF